MADELVGREFGAAIGKGVFYSPIWPIALLDR